MSPARTQARSGAYRPPRARREIALAVLGVLAVVIVTAVLIWVFAPASEVESFPTDLTIPTGVTSAPDVSGTTLPAPATTVGSTPG
jgi:hypothetical protein